MGVLEPRQSLCDNYSTCAQDVTFLAADKGLDRKMGYDTSVLKPRPPGHSVLLKPSMDTNEVLSSLTPQYLVVFKCETATVSLKMGVGCLRIIRKTCAVSCAGML